MAERAEIISPGFSVADAEIPKIEYFQQRLRLEFVDWNGVSVQVDFSDVIAFAWQEAEVAGIDGERWDSVHIIHDSTWLADHERQGVTWKGATWQHLRVCFNVAGPFDVLCTGFTVTSAAEVGP